MTDEPEHPEPFAPGTFGCHEALHEASILTDMLIADLYQKIGAAHLPALEVE